MDENPKDGLVVQELRRPARRPYAAARRRYRVAKWLCAVLALCGAGYVVWVSAEPDGLSVAALDPKFDVQSAALLVVAGAFPWLLVHMLWRRARRRNFWEWQ